MIVTKVRGGLGNQLFTYAAGRCLSVIYNLPLVLDTSWYATGSRELLLNNFNISGEEKKEDQSGCDDGIGFNQKYWNYYPEFLELTNYKFLSGWWQSEQFFKQAEDIIRNELIFIDSMLIKKSHQYFNTYTKPHVPVVAIHCRRGDYVGLSQQGMFKLLSPLYYMDAMSQFTENTLFLLFSDDLGWCKKFLRDPRIVYCEVEDPLLSFAIMLLCDHYIIANSSFSWWAAWLGEKKNSLIVSPDNTIWFGSKLSRKYETGDIVPDRWMQIIANGY